MVERSHFTAQYVILGFPYKQSLDGHTGVHERRKPMNCSYCDDIFLYTPLVIKYPESEHKGKKTFPCILCDKGFSSKYHLKEH